MAGLGRDHRPGRRQQLHLPAVRRHLAAALSASAAEVASPPVDQDRHYQAILLIFCFSCCSSSQRSSQSAAIAVCLSQLPASSLARSAFSASPEVQ